MKQGKIFRHGFSQINTDYIGCCLLGITIIVLASFSAVSASVINPGYSKEINRENNPRFTEVYQIRLVNQKGKPIEISADQGMSWSKLGRVEMPASVVNRKGYRASWWSTKGTVCASAVNAIHIKTDENLVDERGCIFSILPREQFKVEQYASYLDISSSIYTDIPAGESIFGGQYSVFVGNPVYLTRKSIQTLLPATYRPEIGDELLIKVFRPNPFPEWISFENRFGGRIMLKYDKVNDPVLIGQVLRPVVGVGRFLGTQYASKGRLRANHSGVFDVSTSPAGEIGGFQIMPSIHAMSPEMWRTKTSSQWMVVGPVNASDGSWEGIAPLFAYYLAPRYESEDAKKLDWENKLLRRYQVLVKYENQQGWQIMPEFAYSTDKPLPQKAKMDMGDIEGIKIIFPVFIY